MTVPGSMADGRARHFVRAAVVDQKEFAGSGGGQGTARPTMQKRKVKWLCIHYSTVNATRNGAAADMLDTKSMLTNSTSGRGFSRVLS